MLTGCCIAGGGPAGMMLGYLLARQGVDVVVLEQHADFLRDFRGDTVHPSTMQVLHELGLLDAFLQRPHQQTERIALHLNDRPYDIVDFTHLPVAAKFVAFMPQWEFLDFLAEQARALPSFQLRLETQAHQPLVEAGRVRGVRARAGSTTLDIRALLTVACDGRDSTLRGAMGLKPKEKGAPIDVLWFAMPREDRSDEGRSLGHMKAGGMLVTLNRGDYWQCALVIPKGAEQRIRQEGLESFRARVAHIAPHLGDETMGIESMDDVKGLNVQVSRMERWWDEGFLAIGDAAHAMSPVGGVGINLAVQDAVAAGQILAGDLKAGSMRRETLEAVQKRREWPARVLQAVQVFAHDRVVFPALEAEGELGVPWVVKLLNAVPLLRRLPARAIGLGPRPEHWRGPDFPSGVERRQQG